MRILITGGLGFIGGRLAAYLTEVGHDIVIASRNPDHPPDSLSHIKIRQINWSDQKALEESCKDFDVVFHAAGMSSSECKVDPVAAMAFNGLATARLVSSASKVKVRRFIYISTAHVYSDPLVGLISEDTCPHNLHPYATSHVAGENAVLYASSKGDINGSVLRLANVFGVPAHTNVNCWMLFLNDICKQVVTTGEINLKTSGNQQRDFLSVSKLNQIVGRLLLEKDVNLHKAIINVGSGESRKILEMAELVKARYEVIYNKKAKIYATKNYEQIPNLPLQYVTKKLTSISNDINNNTLEEIDDLLRYCAFF